MDSFSDIVRSRAPKEPEEVSKIKQYVKNKYNYEVKVKVSPFSITILSPNAALAGALQQDIVALKELSNTDNLRIIIG